MASVQVAEHPKSDDVADDGGQESDGSEAGDHEEDHEENRYTAVYDSVKVPLSPLPPRHPTHCLCVCVCSTGAW
jgi:hypothetical protein